MLREHHLQMPPLKPPHKLNFKLSKTMNPGNYIKNFEDTECILYFKKEFSYHSKENLRSLVADSWLF